MRKVILSVLLAFLVISVFADGKKKVENVQELDEKSQLEFDYSFMEGVRCKITGDFQAAKIGRAHV